MTLRRGMKLLLMLLALLLPISCSALYSERQEPMTLEAEHNDLLAYGKYDQTVVLRIGFKVPDSRLTTGDSNDNNPVSRYLESLTNIRVIHAWEAKGEDLYTQKVQLAIDSGDLPDAMVVDRDQLAKLIDGDMIADLTETFQKYGSSLIKEMYDSTDGEALTDASRDGRLYALPNVGIHADSATLLWVRQDWLDRLELNPPQTLEDIEKIAQAFIERDPDGNGKRDTVGLSAYRNIVYGSKPHVNGLDGIFSAFHAFPSNWIRTAEGEIIYGSIMPETKEALAKLAEWYERGLIDPEFPLYLETQEPIISGKAGMFFGPWWMPYYPLSEAVALDTRAEWRAFAVPLDAQGEYVTHMAPVTDRYLVVRKGYEHPDAVVKLVNTFTRLERRRDPNELQVRQLDDFSAQTGIQLRAYYPFDLLIDYAASIEKHYEEVQLALQGKLDPESLNPDAQLLYRSWLTEEEQPKKNLEGWKAVNSYKYGASVLISTPMVRVRSAYYGSTPHMQQHWEKLRKLEQETFLNIIVGDEPLSTFDAFVDQWRREGGDVITSEVAAIVESAAERDIKTEK